MDDQGTPAHSALPASLQAAAGAATELRQRHRRDPDVLEESRRVTRAMTNGDGGGGNNGGGGHRGGGRSGGGNRRGSLSKVIT